MQKDLTDCQIAIIGAGLSGISAAQTLTARGAAVTIFEKSRGYGGRCATKRWEGHIIDHGAQFFTLRSQPFQATAQAACGDALKLLQAPVLNEKDDALPDSGRWYHRDGNSRLVRDLARGLKVITETPVSDARALLKSAGGSFDHVICTAPWAQTAALFDIETDHEHIPCLAVLLAYQGSWAGRSREAYAFSDHESEMAWSACENHKQGRVSEGATVIVAHMSERFSREHLERPPAEYPELVRSMVEQRWQLPAGSLTAALGHRWRLARSRSTLILPDLMPGLHFTGDALRTSRVEDAWLAGHQFAQTAAFHF